MLATIRTGLDELRAADPGFKVFGAGSHRYKLHRPYPLDELSAFERAQGITLPDEYRAFITELGNGGAGPSYGVMPFRGGDSEDYTKYDRLSEPFPYNDLYNPDELLVSEDDEDEDEDDDYEDDEDDPHHRYWDAFSQDGMLYICHHGCASRSMLIVSGACRGQVWHDETANDAGYLPSIRGAPRQGFFAWYLDWIERSLSELGARR